MSLLSKSVAIFFCILSFKVVTPTNSFSSPVPKGFKSIWQIEKMKEDTVKFRTLIRLADTLVYTNDDSAAIYYLKAHALAKKLDYKRGIIHFVRGYRRYLVRKGDYKAALKLEQEEGMPVAKALGDKTLIAGRYNNIGQAYNELGQLEKAAENYLMGIKIGEEIKDSPLVQRIYNNLSYVFLDMHNPEKGLYYAKKSHEMALKNNIMQDKCTSLATLGIAQKENKLYNEALESFEKMRLISKEIKKTNFKVGTDYDFASCCYKSEVLNVQKKYAEALEKQKRAFELLPIVPWQDNELMACMDIAETYYHLKSYKEANEYINRSIVLAKAINAPIELSKAYKLGSDINENINLKEALAFRKKYEIVSDSVSNAQKETNVEQMEIEFQTEKKEKEIAQQLLALAQKEVQIKKKDYIIAVIISITIFLCFAIVVVYLLYKNKQRAILEKLNLLEKEKELQVLEAMMNGEERERSRLAKDLHDGVGGLLSATKMHLSILRNEQEQKPNIEKFEHTMSILDTATKEIRSIAHNLAPELLTNYGLDNALEIFCESVTSDTININYCSIGEIPRLRNNVELIVYRTAQELVNNAIKHSKAAQVFVQLSHHSDFMTLSVEDNGIGMTESDKNGIGMINLRSRVESLNGALTINSIDHNGTTIYVEFDISKFKVNPNVLIQAMAS